LRGWLRLFEKSRARWLLLLFVLGLGGALVWWWGPWRKWDVRIQFLRFEGAGGERMAPASGDGASFAVFEIANRSGEGLMVPYEPAQLTYELLSPDGERTTYAAKPAGRWVEVEPGASREEKIPLRCPDGTPITGAFRVGFELRDKSGVQRLLALTRQPSWAAYVIYTVLPRSYFRGNTRVYWTETVTP
jgi:hypothetical protein